MSQLRLQGVHSKSLPTIKSLVISSASFSTGGMIGQFERKYLTAMLCNNPTDKQIIFGNQINSAWYGDDAVKGFFDNIAPISGSLYIKSHVGYTGSAVDAVVASATLKDITAVTPLDTLKISAAYQTTDEYGISGNRTGFQLIRGNRFSTTSTVDTASGDAFVTCSSVAGILVGDLVAVGAAPLYIKVTSIDETAKKIFFTGTVGSIIASGAAVNVLGFQLKTYRKSMSGVETETSTDLGKVWCTLEPEVSQFYVQNVHSTNTFIKATDLSAISTLNTSWPAAVTTTQYLTSGADGTAATTSAHWGNDLAAFNNLPIRFLANCETTDKATQDALETYCYGREDMPKVIYNISDLQTKSQLITTGQSFQKSRDVLGIICAQWLYVTDPFANSSLAPDRIVPNVGHIMGTWVRSINTLGIHYAPAVSALSINGITGIVGDQILDDGDRTDLCNAGINCIQYSPGNGFVLRSAYTPSTADEFKPVNGIFMRDFFKVSIEAALKNFENEPNNFARIRTSADAIKGYMNDLWTRGSTGNVPTGETFGQSLQSDGVTPTTFDQHIVVEADLVNNPQSSINLGNRNLWLWFSYPAPSGSIMIGVGILVR